MAIFSPGMTTALAAGAQGGDLAQQMLARQLANQRAQQQAQDEAKQRQARILIGSMLQQAQGGPQAIPGAAGGPGGPAPTGGMSFGAGGMKPIAPPPQPAQQAPAPAMPGAAMGAPEATAMPWGSIMDALRAKTGADPEVIYNAVQDLAPTLEKESERQFKRGQLQMQLDQKNQALLQQLQWRYYNTDSAKERTQIKADMDRIVAQMRGEAQRDVAGINASSRERVADIGAQSRISVAGILSQSREKIADAANAIKKELGEGALDIKADQVAKTYWVKNREIELKQQGLDQKQAQFQAKLESTVALAQMRDATTQRGQDLIHQDRVDAESGRNTRQQLGIDAKKQALQAKALPVAEEAIAKSDELVADAMGLLDDPNLDKSVGARVAHMPGFLNQDVQNFRDKLDSFKAEKMMALIQQLKSYGNGSTGFGRITNFEAQSLQNSIASLRDTQSPEQFRAALTKLIDQVSASRARIVDAYEREFAKKAAGTGGAGVPVVRPEAAGQGIQTPDAVANEPDGTIFEMGGKQYEKRGSQSIPVGG